MRPLRWLMSLPLRLRSLLRRGQVEQELQEEMLHHLERQIEQNVAGGMPLHEARYDALRRFGGVEKHKDQCRDTRRVRFLEELVQDLRYAARQLRQSPSFTIGALVILALGIGANVSIFSVTDTVLLKKLPVHDPDRLYMLRAGLYGFSYPAYELLRDENEVFSHTFTFVTDRHNVTANAQPQFATIQLVTHNYFSALGVPARFGRTITETDTSAVAVISDSYWQTAYSRAAEALGSVITINQVPFTIVGVAPPEFFGASVGQAPELWIPIEMLPRINPGNTSLSDSGTTWLGVMARLKPGVSERQAQANLDVLLPAVREKMGIPESAVPGLKRIDLLPGSAGPSSLRDQYSLTLRILVVVVGMVLLIACSNLATLLMSRGAGRGREMAIRLAIGAPRRRIVRQLLTESVFLSTMGGLFGLAFAVWSSRALGGLISIGDGRLPVHIDVRVLAFSAVLSLVTGVLFGMAPALRTTRVHLSPVLKEGERNIVGPRQRLGKALIVVQVALSLLLVTGAGLFIRTVHNLKTTELGFDPENLIVMTLEPGLAGYEGSSLMSLYREIMERVQAVPGVRSASISRFGLIGGGYASRTVSVPGYVSPVTRQTETSEVFIGARTNQAATNTVGPGFFEAAGIGLVAGRDFNTRDTGSAPGVAIVNTRFARTYFGDANPIGRTFGFRPPPAPQFEIVGLVQDSKFFRLRNESPPTVFLPFLQADGANTGAGQGRAFLSIRTGVEPNSLVGAIRNELDSIAKEMPVHDVRTQEEQLDANIVRERLLAALSGFFGVFALLLSSVGLYGVMSYSVARRTNEIGIRVALGARTSEVARLVLAESLQMVFIGVIIGAAASLALTRFIAGLLFDLAPNDPVSMTLAIASMSTAAAFASYLPARRASHLDPITALRHE